MTPELLGCPTLLISILFKILQVEGMLSVLSWLEHAKPQSLSGCKAMVSEVCKYFLQFNFTHVIIGHCLHGIYVLISLRGRSSPAAVIKWEACVLLWSQDPVFSPGGKCF